MTSRSKQFDRRTGNFTVGNFSPCQNSFCTVAVIVERKFRFFSRFLFRFFFFLQHVGTFGIICQQAIHQSRFGMSLRHDNRSAFAHNVYHTGYNGWRTAQTDFLCSQSDIINTKHGNVGVAGFDSTGQRWFAWWNSGWSERNGTRHRQFHHLITAFDNTFCNHITFAVGFHAFNESCLWNTKVFGHLRWYVCCITVASLTTCQNDKRFFRIFAETKMFQHGRNSQTGGISIASAQFTVGEEECFVVTHRDSGF